MPCEILVEPGESKLGGESGHEANVDLIRVIRRRFRVLVQCVAHALEVAHIKGIKHKWEDFRVASSGPIILRRYFAGQQTEEENAKGGFEARHAEAD